MNQHLLTTRLWRRLWALAGLLPLLTLSLAIPLPGWAASGKDVKIALHIIDYILNLPADRTHLGIVYDPLNRDSVDDAQSILGAMQSATGLTQNGNEPLLVEIKTLEQQNRLRGIFVANGMRPYYDRIAAFGRTSRTLILSADLDCVRAGKCTVAVASNPRVEILLNARQAADSAIQFTEAFRMMVKEY